MGEHPALLDRRSYERQIERLHQRSLLTGRLYDLRQDDVSLASIVMNRAKVARLLARDIRLGRYSLEPGELRRIRVRDKTREVFAYRLTDLIVHGVVADLVQKSVEPQMSARVFSYRAGFTQMVPVTEFATYLRRHRNSIRDVRARGVYVLRRDVDSYTDAIPLDERSLLWTMLEERLGSPLPDLVKQVVRVEMKLPDGGTVCRLRGLPMGQPIASVIANFYLRDVDRALEAVPGGFYARYGDDFLFAHPDAAVAKDADAVIDDVLERLSLTVNASKRRTSFLTPAGRAPDAWPDATGAQYVPFLGTRITAEGTVGLDGKKMRGLLADIERRVRATVRTVPGDRDDVGRALCAVVNSVLDPTSVLSQQKSAALVRRVVTDRAQLRQLDYAIARIVVVALTGRSDARAFRAIPYRKLRREWGLISLVAARNATRQAR